MPTKVRFPCLALSSPVAFSFQQRRDDILQFCEGFKSPAAIMNKLGLLDEGERSIGVFRLQSRAVRSLFVSSFPGDLRTGDPSLAGERLDRRCPGKSKSRSSYA